jgi:signal transduction histidine kinase/HAMP domain-containing protein
MTLRMKLALGMAPLVLAMLIIGVVGGRSFTQLAQSSERILQDNYRTLLALQRMTRALEQLDAAALVVVSGQPPVADEATLAAAQKRFEDELVVQEHNISEAGEGEATKRLRRAWTAYLSARDRFTAQPSPGAIQQDYLASLHPALVEVRAAQDQILTLNQEAMSRKSRQVKETAESSLSFLLLVSVAGLLIALTASARIVDRLLRPLSVLGQATRRLGTGDVAARARIEGRDEIAQLATDFNAMAEQLQKYRDSSLGELLDAQEESQATIDSLPDPVFVLTVEGQLLYANHAAAEALGVTVEKGLAPLDPAVAAVLATVQRHVASGQGPWVPSGLDKAVRVSTAAGERNYLCRGAPVHSGEGAIIKTTVVLQDVTRLLRFEEQRNDLVATVAHELRTPLTSLRMAIHVLSGEQVGALTAKQSDLVFAAREDCDRLQSTVDELLDLARIQAGRIELRTTSAEVEELVGHALDAHRPFASTRKVQLRSEVLPGTGHVQVDVDRVQLVFANLLDNAIRNSAAEAAVTVRAFSVDGFIRFEVLDSGPGIAREFHQAIFERYFQLPDKPPGGAGMGLSIAREIVHAHGGEIGLESEPGKGAKFWFKLPKVASSPAALTRV